jgi:outer membrane protein
MYWFIFLLFIGAQAFAAPSLQPIPTKFEWGVGVLNFYGNHYRGSDQCKLWSFPLPYFTYTSEYIEAEPSFIRGVLFHNHWFSFKLSLMAGLNAESEKNRARAGMPSLDYTVEAGPLFIFYLWHTDNKNLALNFEWPVRKVFATDLSYLKDVGYFTVPYINLLHTPDPSSWMWNSEFSVSPMFADKKYHQYFYEVSKEFATPSRPVYQAHGGYSGFQSAIVLNKHFGNLVVLPLLRWDYLQGSSFSGSPLVKTKNYFLGGLGFFWLIK